MTDKAKITDEFEFEIEKDEDGAETPHKKPEVDVIDDTPDEDKDRAPLPKQVLDDLEADELDEYDERVKQRLKQAKKTYHDERREKERALRENQEAVAATQRLLEENRKLRETLSKGEETLLSSFKQSNEFELNAAKKEYREAYEAGDTDRVIEAQEKLNTALYRAQQLSSYDATLQGNNTVVEKAPEVAPAPRPDAKTMAWQERNTWYGSEPEMTASALGLHQKLVNQHGADYAGTSEYWSEIDSTIRRRFPEYFGESEVAPGRREESTRDEKLATVVAPASRSRSPKKIVLKQSQVALAKKLGLTPEQYARELMKMEN